MSLQGESRRSVRRTSHLHAYRRHGLRAAVQKLGCLSVEVKTGESDSQKLDSHKDKSSIEKVFGRKYINSASAVLLIPLSP